MIKEIQDYIDFVRSGKIRVCEEQILLIDLVENAFKTESIYVDEEQLHKYLSLQKYFPFKLLEWEVFCFTLHNCTYKAPGRLRWPDLFVMVGRGAGKNGYLSFEDFCLMTKINGIKKYNIDICANSEEQAKTSFDDVYEVLEDNKAKLSRSFTWNKEIIINTSTGSELKFRTNNSKTKDGGRPGKVDFDEYHAYEDYKNINVFTTGLGKKKQPRTTIITTNGDVRDGPLDKKVSIAMDILKGKIPDNGLLPFICRLPNKEEVDDPLNWDKANPSLHAFPDLQDQLKKEYIDYKEDPISNSAFMTKRMNVITLSSDKEVTTWDNILATNQPIPYEDLQGANCYAATDYAKTTDFVSAGLLFNYKGKFVWITHTWVCSKSRDLQRIKAPLKEWEKAGFLTFIDDDEISPDIPAEWFAEQGEKYYITRFFIDNYRWTLLRKSFNQVGFDTDKKGYNNVTLIRPSHIMLAYPTINSAFTNHNIIWGDNPLMRWACNNTCLHPEKYENYTFAKIEPKSRKTDPFMAFVTSMAGNAIEELEECGDDVGLEDFDVFGC